jgi:mRNA interferase RelE/StbE
MTEGWDWEFTDRAEAEFSDLDAAVQRQLLKKLDEVVSSEFREPPDFLKPLTDLPYSSLRSGDYRGIIDVDRESQLLWVMSVGHRDDVYDDFP